ncbi:MAG: methylenetetrahydrofolate reductase [Treponema sp.]|jgi:methylenetetrahydrofolate reductase (NADPH)|nr:methylenetetrahydrofolate reductase [Treponema sp.]
MRRHIQNKIYHVEILPPKQASEKLREDLKTFTDKYEKVRQSGRCACITDNAMGLLAFQGAECIEELGLAVSGDQVMIHLNTFHTKENIHEILDSCKKLGIRYLLVVSGDGSDRLPKLQPADVGAADVQSVTSVELLRYINREYPGFFTLGVAFNPYEPPEHEFEKLKRKFAAGASFIITQPIIEKNAIIDEMLQKYPDVPVIIEAWMSKKIGLLSEAVGYTIPEDTPFDPIATLTQIHKDYPNCGVYLSLLGFKTQYPLISETWK